MAILIRTVYIWRGPARVPGASMPVIISTAGRIGAGTWMSKPWWTEPLE